MNKETAFKFLHDLIMCICRAKLYQYKIFRMKNNCNYLESTKIKIKILGNCERKREIMIKFEIIKCGVKQTKATLRMMS